jgi:polysaccharide biosynthesis transport protein
VTLILQDYVRLLRRGAWLLAAMVMLGAAGGLGVAALTEPTYFSRATVVVSAGGDSTPGDLAQVSSFGVQRAPTYAGVAGSSTVLDPAAAALGGGLTAQDLAEAVNVTVRTDTALIDIDAEAPTGEDAAARANAVATALARVAPSVDGSSVVITPTQVAQVPEVADSPRPRNDLIAGAVVGLALGVIALAFWQALDDKIRAAADVPRSRSLRVVSVLPYGRRGKQDEVRSEGLRRLRAVLTAGPGGDRSVVAVASVSSSSEKDAEEVAVGLAQALSETGASVLVIDLTAPSRPLGARGEGSIAGRPSGQLPVLAGEVDDVSWLVPENLGTTPAALVGTADGRAALDQLTGGYDHRVLLCPPALDRSEISVVAGRATATLLVADAGRTSRSGLQRAAGSLTSAGVATVSVVLVGGRTDEALAV